MSTVASPLDSATIGVSGSIRGRVHRSRPPLRLATTWWFVVPALAFYAFVVLIPSGSGVLDAFTDWDGMSPEKTFTGLDNFIRVTDDKAAIGAIVNTIVIAVALALIQTITGLSLALGIKSGIKSHRVLRVVFFAPAVVAPVMTAYLWKYILAPDGPLDVGLESIGLGALQQDWLGDATFAMASIIAVIVWQFSGLTMLIFLAGLESIPHEVLEAAEVDGADSFRKFIHITRPLLRPAFLVAIFLTLVGGLKQFDVVWVLTQGGPANSTHTLSTLIFKNAFQFSEYGYSIALALILVAIALPVAALQHRATNTAENVT